jgi:hypothetical protein
MTSLLTISIVLIAHTPVLALPGSGGSVIGKIAGVTADSFALQVAADDGRTMMYFLLGPGTRIEGEMKIGIDAGVEYIALGSCNLATHVMIDSRNRPSYFGKPPSLRRGSTVFRVFA